MVASAALLVLLAASSRNVIPSDHHDSMSGKEKEEVSRWSRRTAKRRLKTDQLLTSIMEGGAPPPSSFFFGTNLLQSRSPSINADNVPTLQAPRIDWNRMNPALDPIHGGRIRPDTPRGARKRAQVEAFVFVVSSLLAINANSSGGGTTIIDAGCGAGNLAIPLAGLVTAETANVEVLAVDVNEFALQRLSERADSILPSGSHRTLCADLACPNDILSSIPAERNVIVVSLHACGAASDMAMNLAYAREAPFAICPCCTAKSLTKRRRPLRISSENEIDTIYDKAASFQRSGASADIEYPRSEWLRSSLSSSSSSLGDNDGMEEQYAVLAKVADVGLGPQTPSEQREHQRRAKLIVELDRLAAGSEGYGYDVRLLRIRDHDPTVYGKGELLLGAKRGSAAANVLNGLPVA